MMTSESMTSVREDDEFGKEVDLRRRDRNKTGFSTTSQDVNWGSFLRIHVPTIQVGGTIGASTVVHRSFRVEREEREKRERRFVRRMKGR